jgi:hypothetical protein
MTTAPIRPTPLSDSTEPARLVNARRFLLGITTNNSADALTLLAPEVVYTVAGHSPLAGVFHGPAQVDAHLRQLLTNIWLFFEDPDDVDRLLAKVPRVAEHTEEQNHDDAK